MAFNIENGSGSTLDINDFGIQLALGEIVDLAQLADPQTITISAQASNELSTLITSGDVIVKDPIDGVTDLSVADGLEVARSQNDPHWRVGAGSRIGDISDVDVTGVADGNALVFASAGSEWTPVDPATIGGSGSFQLEWRFQTPTTATDPGSKNFQFNSATPASVTELYVSDTSDSGVDATTLLSALSAGDKIYIQQNDDALAAYLFNVTGPAVDNTTWWNVPVSVDSVVGILPGSNRRCAWVLMYGLGGGSGSVPIIQEDAVALAGAPHSTINYGLGLLATDAGSNVADIDLDASIDDLNDVTITSAANNNQIKFDSGTGQWINVAGQPGPPAGSELWVQMLWNPIAGLSGTTSIVIDELLPDIAEGTEVWSDTIDIQDTSSTIRIETSITFTGSTSSMELVFAAFRGSTCVGATVVSNPNKDTGTGAAMIVYDSPATTGDLTYSVRVGKNGGPGTWYVNTLPGFTTPLGGVLEQNAYTLAEIGAVT